MIVPMIIKVKTTGIPGHMKRSEINRIKKTAWDHVGVLWHRNMRDKHFRMSAYEEYDFEPRSGADMPKGSKAYRKSYVCRKFRQRHHNRPLVWTGSTETSTRIARIQPSSKGVKIYMRAPNLNRIPRLREELVRVTPEEIVELTRRWHKKVKSLIRDNRRVTVEVLNG